MVKVIIGKKGSGKTKMLVEMVNEAGKESEGNVVFIEKGKSLTYDIKPAIRLISATEYGIDNYKLLRGFIAGIMAGNYDCTEIFIDSATKICAGDLNELAEFLEQADLLTTANGVTLTTTVSADISDVGEAVKKYVVN